MANENVESVTVIDLSQESSGTAEVLLNSAVLKIVRLTIPAGKQIPEHTAPGPITVHCLKGIVDFTSGGQTHRLAGNQVLVLPHRSPHSLVGIEAASVLVTIVLRSS